MRKEKTLLEILSNNDQNFNLYRKYRNEQEDVSGSENWRVGENFRQKQTFYRYRVRVRVMVSEVDKVK
jgi:hypothetical protein